LKKIVRIEIKWNSIGIKNGRNLARLSQAEDLGAEPPVLNDFYNFPKIMDYRPILI